jgi:hypothetical protein
MTSFYILLRLKIFLVALVVSRAWNKRFSCPDVCITFIKVHFMATWGHKYDAVAIEYQELSQNLLTRCILHSVMPDNQGMEAVDVSYRRATPSLRQAIQNFGSSYIINTLNHRLLCRQRDPIRKTKALCVERRVYLYCASAIAPEDISWVTHPRSRVTVAESLSLTVWAK